VHGAKGEEFPVVIVAGLGTAPSTDNPPVLYQDGAPVTFLTANSNDKSLPRIESSDYEIAKDREKPPVPTREMPDGRGLPPVPDRVDDAEWKEFDFDDLQRGLSAQRSNTGRIRVPTWDEVKKVLPPGFPPPKSPVRIQWSLVCMGYQPELGAAWSACTTAFREESKQDMVFEESLFWVVTRTIHCFY